MSKSEKPQLSESEEKGRFGSNYVKNIIENGWRCVLHEREGYPDRGIDGTVIDQRRGRMTAIEFNVQIKARKYIGDNFPAPLERGHLELYRDSHTPVVIICVDLGPPACAYWKLIKPEEADKAIQKNEKIRISRQKVFGPDSRDAVITEVRRAFPKQAPPANGQVLGFPIHLGIRDAAKDYYRRKLMPDPHDNPMFGPIEFTWKGWRHITRQNRSNSKIPSSFLLLPCIRNVLDQPVLPSSWRHITPIDRGSETQYRTLLVFERVIIFRHRAPAWVRVVVDRQAVFPTDWATSSPVDDPRRKLRYKFLSVSELWRLVKPSDLGD